MNVIKVQLLPFIRYARINYQAEEKMLAFSIVMLCLRKLTDFIGRKSIMTKDKHFTEAEIIKFSGYSRQTLLNMRKGRTSGKYAYPPRLESPEHFIIFGRTIMYTEKGKAEILKADKKSIKP